MDRIAVDELQTIVLVDETKPNASATKGALLEAFFARILHALGYEDPSTSNLNVTSNGIELDVVAKRRVVEGKAVAECKAYSSNIPATMLDAFYGKLTLERMDAEGVAGFFVALPRLTSPGEEQAARIEKNDPNFKYLNSRAIAEILKNEGLLTEPPDEAGILSDTMVLITTEGIHQAAHRLDPQSRTTDALVVWAASRVPDPVFTALQASSLANGLPVLRSGQPGPLLASHEDQLIVKVSASSSDFEYQLPAAPKFFVGRRPEISDLRTKLTAPDPLVVVLNAQSGWGKSSLALRMSHEVSKAKGRALILDSRTASSQSYVPEALRALADEATQGRILTLPEDPAFGTIASSLQTLERANWHHRDRPLLLFFDQFENVFRDADLTRAFRDLALATNDLNCPLKVGFAWKTDLVGWTEDHPYQLRDEIRSASHLVSLKPFGPSEVSTLLKRLQDTVGGKLGRDIRDRLREYSGGLPWLFKKLAGHLIREMAAGRTEEELVAGALNVQGLFEADLAELSLKEQETLRSIARSAPVAMSDLLDTLDLGIVQSLLDRRLVVQVGERLDTYWDIFRDYLNTGAVPIKDGYILRLQPTHSMGTLLRTALDSDGMLSVNDAADMLETSESVIFNSIRELRLLGLITYKPGEIQVASDILTSHDPESALQERARASLQRHRAFDVLQHLLDTGGGEASIATFAEHLGMTFPAVQARPATWNSYARAFTYWFAYAGLVGLTPAGVTADPADTTTDLSLLSREGRVSVSGTFPQSAAGPAIEVGLAVATGDSADLSTPRARSGIRALETLKLAATVDGRVFLTVHGKEAFTQDGTTVAESLRTAIERVAGATEALEALRVNPTVTPEEVGLILKVAQSAAWANTTTRSVGRHFRSWARAAGVDTARRRTPAVNAAPELF